MSKSLYLGLFLLCVNFIAVVQIACAQQPAKSPGYVNSATCDSCHQAQYAAWSNSHHSWAWREPTDENIKGDFSNSKFEHAGFVYRFEADDGVFYALADSPDGNAKRYPVRYVVGVTPLQQYLVETEPGRLQALDVAWDTARKRWYHLYPDEDTSVGNGLHWSGSYKNWNARCAECHATDFKKNYEPGADRYHSTQAEIGVGCEACHGPGEAHVAWANEPKDFNSNNWLEVDATGLTATYESGDAASEINLCASCHSRREPLGGNSPPAGAAFDDHYRLALLRNGLYFPDGQIHDEVYVYGSFLQSRMHARGVRCTNCHEPHSYRLKLEGNGLCTRCHNPEGNKDFPTLKKADYDTREHHFHEPGSDGAACKSCHMPERLYMVVDGRRDHSFRVPRPDLAIKLDVPDPCTQCHLGKTPKWAAGEISKRFPKGRATESHYGELFAMADQGQNEKTVKELVTTATSPAMPAIVRASALQRLTAMSGTVTPEQFERFLRDDSPLVRMTATGLQVSLPTGKRVDALVPLLNDPVQSVRLQAARAFLGISPDSIPEHVLEPLGKAMGEWQRSLHAKVDFPETHLVMGGVALTQRNLPAASSAFRRAVEMDPQLLQAWLMLARIQAAQGDRAAVTDTLRKALRKNPGSIELQQAMDEISPAKSGGE